MVIWQTEEEIRTVTNNEGGEDDYDKIILPSYELHQQL